MAKQVLIYDDECAYCRGFAHLVRPLDFRKRFIVLPFESDQAQALLRAQFGKDFGFAMFLFEEERVSWGAEAAKRIVQALALPGASLAFWLYPRVVRLVSWLTRRERTACGPECATPEDKHQTVPLQTQVKLSLERMLKHPSEQMKA
jgi:predicted DCC family thiol-disulfide oxidoreductase YuxK